MGTLLRGRFQFTSLRGIREAYAAAFPPDERVDSLLADKALDALEQSRTSIVHGAAIGELSGTDNCSVLSADHDEGVLEIVAPVCQIAASLLQAFTAELADAEK